MLKRSRWALAVLVLGGCFTGRYSEGNPIAWAALSSVQPGLTTKSEVLERFGAPRNFTSPTALAEFLDARGLEPEAYAGYPFSDVFAYQMNYARLRGFTLVLYTRFKVDIVSDLVVVFFDERGIVSHLGVRRADETLD